MKLIKKISAVAMTAALAFSAVPAYAAETTTAAEPVAVNDVLYTNLSDAELTYEPMGITVQLNGKNLEMTDVEPFIKDSRVFVPFRTVFEALGAEIAYDDATKTIKATTADEVVTFTIGKTDVTVEKDGETTTVATDAASFVEKGYTYVPVRFAAQSLGCEVGWDSDFQTVVIVDKDAILGGSDNTYELIEKCSKEAAAITEENPAFDGSLDFALKVTTPESPMEVEGTFDMYGKTTSKQMVFNSDIKLDLKDIIELIKSEGGEIDENTQSILDLAKDFNLDMVMNIDDGVFYVTCPLLDKALNLEENTWVSLDFNEILSMSGMNMDFATLVSMSKDVNYAEMVSSMLDLTDINNSYLTAANIQSAEMMVKLYADSSLTKTDEGYVSEYTYDQYGSTVKMVSTIKTDANDNIVGYKLTMDMLMGSEPMMTITVDNTGVNTDINMNMAVEGIMEFTIDGSYKYQKNMNKTLNTVKTDSKILSMEDMIASLTAAPSVDTAVEVTEVTEAEATTEAPATTTEVTTEAPATEAAPAA